MLPPPSSAQLSKLLPKQMSCTIESVYIQCTEYLGSLGFRRAHPYMYVCLYHLFHYVYPWHMYTLLHICKSGCSMYVLLHCNIVHYPTLYCDSHAPCAFSCIHALVLHSSMLFPVWCSALILTDCQSNALTPSFAEW